MSFSWLDYYRLAERLRSENQDSPLYYAHLRCSISRAYFAAFCIARNYLINNHGQKFDGVAEDHVAVRNYFYDHRRQNIADELDHLRIARNKADYDDVMEGLFNTSLMCLNRARRVIEALNGAI